MAKSHPVPDPLAGPRWRGVSELSGEYGDLLYGTYRRSPNAQVVNGGAVGKRRGFIRAVDEQFVGWAQAHYARDGSTLVYLVADGAGVKVLTSIPASTFDTFGGDHAGFMVDEFTRADAAGIQTGTTLPWLEGQDSIQNTAYTEGDLLRIVSNALALRRTDGTSGTADWATAAPTPFFVQRVEISFAGFVKTNATSYAEVIIGCGMPGPVFDSFGTRNHEQVYVADASRGAFSAGNTAWSGLVARLRVNVSDNATPKYKLQANLVELGSTVVQENRGERDGAVIASLQKESGEISTVGNILTNWVIEFGREQVGAVWVPRMDIWRSKTIADIEAATQGDKFMSLELPIASLNGSANGLYYNLPHDGTGGLTGVKMVTNADTTSVHTVPRVKVALNFATRRGED